MSANAWITVVVILVMLVLLVTERVPPAAGMMGAVVVLLFARVIDAGQALSGFSNEAPFIVAGLYILAGAVEATGAAAPLFRWLGASRGVRKNLARIGVGVAGVSSLVNNTTVVASFAPGVSAWARRNREAPSLYLMPVSFAALLGGLLTAIGTSTNITVSGLLQNAGMRGIGFFEITLVGLPVAIAGLAVLIATAPRLLPARHDVVEDVGSGMKDFTVEMVVQPGRLDGRSVEEAGLRHLQGVFLVQLERKGHVIAPVAPDELLKAGDHLLFAGNITMIVDLQTMPGLASAESHHFEFGTAALDQGFYESVIGAESPLVGQTLKMAGFRSRYGAAVVAIHRSGEPIHRKLGEVVLRAGDVLLVLAHPGFQQQWRHSSDFLVIAAVGGTSPVRTAKAWIVYAVIALVIGLAVSGLWSLLEVALLAAFLIVLLGVLSPSEARQAIDVNVVVMIAASFGIGHAVSASGLGATIADGVVAVSSGLGPVGVLAGVFLATVVVTALVNNNAAAVLVFPIGLAAARKLGVDPRAFAMAIAVAASTDFLGPFGYQTNTMVLGMGGYKVSDFARVGFPLTLVVFIVSMLVIPFAWPL